MHQSIQDASMLCSSYLRLYCGSLVHASPGCIGFKRPQCLELRAKAKKEGNLECPSDKMYSSFISIMDIVHNWETNLDTNQMKSFATVQWKQTWTSTTIHICSWTNYLSSKKHEIHEHKALLIICRTTRKRWFQDSICSKLYMQYGYIR